MKNIGLKISAVIFLPILIVFLCHYQSQNSYYEKFSRYTWNGDEYEDQYALITEVQKKRLVKILKADGIRYKTDSLNDIYLDNRDFKEGLRNDIKAYMSDIYSDIEDSISYEKRRNNSKWISVDIHGDTTHGYSLEPQ